jgi:hypothetical protein
MLPLGGTARSAQGALMKLRGWRFRQMVGWLITGSGLVILIEQALSQGLR